MHLKINLIFNVFKFYKSGNRNEGKLTGFKLVLHGTYEKPDYMKNGPRNYDEPTDQIKETTKLDQLEINNNVIGVYFT